MTRAEVDQWAENSGLELLCADGFDDAIVGIGQRFNDTFVIYDLRKVIASLMRDGLSYEDAVEHYEFNIVGAWVGDATPCFLQTEPEP